MIQHIDLSTDPLEQVLKDVEVIFHCAAQPGISSTTPFSVYLEDNIIATQRLRSGQAPPNTQSVYPRVHIIGVWGNGYRESRANLSQP